MVEKCFRCNWDYIFTSVSRTFSSGTKKKRGRWKVYRGNVNVKRRRAYRQEATEKRLIYENRTAEYAAGIGLDIGAESTATTNTTRTRTRRTHCRCGSTTHLTTRSRQCSLNKNIIQNNIQNNILCGETNEEKVEFEVSNGTIGGKSVKITEM